MLAVLVITPEKTDPVEVTLEPVTLEFSIVNHVREEASIAPAW